MSWPWRLPQCRTRQGFNVHRHTKKDLCFAGSNANGATLWSPGPHLDWGNCPFMTSQYFRPKSLASPGQPLIHVVHSTHRPSELTAFHPRPLQRSTGGQATATAVVRRHRHPRRKRVRAPCLGGCDVGCTCHRGGSGLRACSAAPYPSWWQVACHLLSQGAQRRAEPLVLCNLLRYKPLEHTLQAGIEFAFS